MDFKQTKLDNGLTIIAEVNEAAVSLAGGFFVRTGSRDETPEVAGVSHFLEHMMFKGTARRGPLDVNRDFDEMGANYNAFTGEENTVYYAAVLPEFQTRILDLLCDLLRPSLRGEDFDVEKNVILEEIAMYQDMPRYRIYDSLMSEFFRGHTLGNSVLGTVESIKALKRDQMQAYFDRRYCPADITVVGVGKIDFAAFVDKVSATCSHWPVASGGRDIAAPRTHVGRKVITDPKVTRQHVAAMSYAPSSQDDLRYAAMLAATIIGDSSGSRLYYSLVEPAIADEANLSYDALDGAGAFIAMLTCDADKTTQAVEILNREIRKFAAGGATAAELSAAKNKIASSATLKGETPMGRLTSVGFDWVYRGEYVPLADQIERMFAVTGEQIMQVVREYDLSATMMLGLGPVEKL